VPLEPARQRREAPLGQAIGGSFPISGRAGAMPLENSMGTRDIRSVFVEDWRQALQEVTREASAGRNLARPWWTREAEDVSASDLPSGGRKRPDAHPISFHDGKDPGPVVA
jgi:hypothetical protein